MSMVVKGMLQLEDLLDKVAVIPDNVESNMLTSAAKIIAEEQKRTATSMLQGPYTDLATGVAQSIQVGKVKKNKRGGLYTDVIFKGRQHGERLATIAFVNEYGVVHKYSIQRPRPFVSNAIENKSAEAVDAEREILQSYIDSQIEDTFKNIT